LNKKVDLDPEKSQEAIVEELGKIGEKFDPNLQTPLRMLPEEKNELIAKLRRINLVYN
jgi:hypothetical protein